MTKKAQASTDRGQDPNGKWRVVFGETMPAWERRFSTKRDAIAFAVKHEGFGDVIFSVAKIVPGEKPQSMQAVLDSEAPQ